MCGLHVAATAWVLQLVTVMFIYTVSGKKWNHYYCRHNLDKQKYIVVIFAQNIVKVMRNQTNTTKVRRT